MRACNGIGSSVSVELPDFIIFHILSYLPLRSLHRFKCVCKLWSTLFLHPTFLYLRQRNSPFSDSLSEDADILRQLDIDNPDRWRGFTKICRSSHNLCLQVRNTSSSSSQYCIESRHLRDTLPIPSPQYPSLCIALEYVPITSNPHGGFVKLVSVHQQDGNNNNLGYEVLSLDNIVTSPCRWRAIDKVVPPLPSDGRMRNSIQLFFRMGVSYCICFVETTEEVDDIQVDVLDMVNETYIGRTTFPRASFFPELSMLHLLDWNGRLSFAQLLKDELHVLVLDDHTKLKWAETKRIIKLNFLKSSTYHKEKLITFHACEDMSTLLFIWQHDKNNQFFCCYDIYTGEFSTSEMYGSSFSDITDAELVALKVAEFAFHGAGLYKCELSATATNKRRIRFVWWHYSWDFCRCIGVVLLLVGLVYVGCYRNKAQRFRCLHPKTTSISLVMAQKAARQLKPQIPLAWLMAILQGFQA